MYRKVAFAAVLAVGVAACADQGPSELPQETPSFDINAAQDGDAIPGRYVVVLRDDLDNVRQHAEDMVRAHSGRLRHVYSAALKGFSADIADERIAALRQDPRVAYAEQDRVVSIRDTQNNPPNWGLDRIDQTNLPLDNSYTYPNDGAGVTFYGLDTGILYSHVDFEGRAVFGFDAITPSTGGEDCDGHGTHTASTAAGETYGVAKGADIVSVRVLNCFGSGTFGEVISGVDFVTADHQPGEPAVANMSLGGGFFQALNDAVAASIADGVVYTLSAGNSFGADACTQSPASTLEAITVGATDQSDQRANFSNIGTCLDIFAPGVNILAAYIGSNTASAILSGTSMSAPHVAGAALLHLAANPGDTPAQVAAALTDNATAGIVGNPGTGSPNLLLNIEYLDDGPPPPPNMSPTASFVWNCNGTFECTFDGTSSFDPDGTISSYEWLRPNGTVWATGSVFVFQFQGPGTGNITLRVTDNLGATDSDTQFIDNTQTTPPGPADPGTSQIDAAPTTIDADGASTSTVTVTLFDAANMPLTSGGDAVTLTTSAGTLGAVTDNGDGTYTATLTSSATPGTATIMGTVNAAPITDDATVTFQEVTPPNMPPTAAFTWSCENLTCTFDATSSSDPDGTIVAYDWLRPNGTVWQTGSVMVFTFGRAGTGNITLRVTDDDGATDTITQSVTIN